METLILGDSIIKYQPTVLNDDHLLKIKVKCFPGINIARLHKTLTPKLVSKLVWCTITCYHILAARIYVGIDTRPELGVN